MARRTKRALKGALAGAAGGLVASYAMNLFQAGLSKLTSRNGQQQPSQQSEEPATVKAAERVSENVFKHTLREEEKGPSGSLVHYLFGTAVGGAYGALAEKSATARVGYGILFGSVLWFLSDEIAVPALGLSKGPKQYPVKTHASALASHLVYGAATELVRSGLRAI